MELILDELKNKTTRESTAQNYYAIWKIFNRFIVKLDVKPHTWEHRLSLFGAYLVDNGTQSSMIKSYFTAIKMILLQKLGYKLNQDSMLLHTLTKACRLVNDTLRMRLPIHRKLLEVILFELERLFEKQFYLEILYKTIFSLSYYGLFRIGEVTQGPHVIKAKDVSIGRNKNKILITLYTSKTHDVSVHLQTVKIAEIVHSQNDKNMKFFCPFQLIWTYIKLRGRYKNGHRATVHIP